MNLYVGNLPLPINKREVEILFGRFGKVDTVRLVFDPSGRPNGWGFVEMPDRGEADRAINGLHGKPYHGRTLTVTEARPGDQQPPNGVGERHSHDVPASMIRSGTRSTVEQFEVGDRVTVRETKVGPRPPASWLGKKGRIVEDRGEKQIKLRVGDHPQRHHAVQLDGVAEVYFMPETWLRRPKTAGLRKADDTEDADETVS